MYIFLPVPCPPGFKTVYKPKSGGRRFAELLEEVARVDPEMRVRFTSPHPKDFPDEVLHMMADTPNICNQIHMPAQSGNTDMLAAMGRGYSREAYLELVRHVRSIVPDAALSSDFIAGFCGETESAHRDTLSLMEEVDYNFAFCFPYSMRQKTRAHRRLVDDVPQEVKLRRSHELHAKFRGMVEARHRGMVGDRCLVLVEGRSKRSEHDLMGRNDANTKVVFPSLSLPYGTAGLPDIGEARRAEVGEYVVVEVVPGSTSLVLKGKPLYRTTLQGYEKISVQDYATGV